MQLGTDHDAELAYSGVRFNVYAVDLPGRGGQSVRREAVATPGAVVVLPLLDDQRVVLIRNERFAVGHTLWELPAGTIEDEEPPDQAAARELTEEAGYRAGQVDKLIEFYPTPGICTERMHAYLARDLEHVGQDLDENERITVEVLGLDRSIQMVRDNTIRDGKTIATLLYYQSFIAGKP